MQQRAVFSIQYLLLTFLVLGFNCNSNAFSVYRVTQIGGTHGTEKSFVDVADGFNWGETEDERVIADEYLAEVFPDGENYHTFEQRYRTRFLKRLGFTENDSLFIYHIQKDTVYSYVISSLKVAAHLTPYEPIEPLAETEFYIGFELDKAQFDTDAMPDFYVDTYLAVVAKTNPFQTGKLQAITWELTSNLNFPRAEKAPIDADMEVIETYYFKTVDYKFYLQKKKRVEANTSGLYLCVIANKTKQVVFKKYYEEGDGSEIKPMRISMQAKGKPLAEMRSPNQWTGQLFKGHPPVIFSFIEEYFDCEKIDFLDLATPAIRISCDNRH